MNRQPVQRESERSLTDRQVIRGILWLAVFTLLLGLSLSSASAKQAKTASIQASLRWFKGYVKQAGDAGAHTSITFADDGTPWISFYDATDTALMVAVYMGSGGNCGPDKDWYCMTADSVDSVGTYSSIDYYYGWSFDWKAGVAYYDATHGALKYGEYTCVLIWCFWDIVTVQDADFLGAPSYGQHASLKFDADGNPLIAFYVSSTMFDDELRYAYRVTSGGNCGVGSAAGLWHCETVDSGDHVGQYASLDFTDFAEVFIAYYDGDADDLKYAYYAGLGNCGSGNAWYCVTVDGTDGSDVGKFVSLHVPQNPEDELQFAYYDASNGKLKYAIHVDGGSGNCGAGTFQCDAIESIGTGLTQAGISLAMDSDNAPVIAYMEALEPSKPSTLKVAQPIYSLDLPSGNCGPSTTWQCTTIDSGKSNEDEAAYAAVALNPDGLAMIAYSAWEHTYGMYDLKIAYQREVIFLPLISNND